jgi:hypothetical protein
MIVAALFPLLMGQTAPAPPPAATPHRRPPCTAARAVTVSIEAIRADEQWQTRCVRVRGIQVGWRLYDSRLAMLESRSAWGSEEARHSLPLLRRAGMGVVRRDRAAEVEVIGIVQSCALANDSAAEEQREHPETIIMVAGYCHTSLEPYLLVRSVRVASPRPVYRLLETEVPIGQRRLVPVSGSDRQVENLRAVAQTLFRAVLDGNERAAVPLIAPDLQSRQALTAGPHADWVRERTAEARALFRRASARNSAFRSALPPDQRQEIVLGAALYGEAPESEAERAAGADLSHLTICWCRLRDCGGRWPVLDSDADNHPSRPYACVRTNDFVLGLDDRTVLQAKPEVRWSGLVEPAPPAGPGGR